MELWKWYNFDGVVVFTIDNLHSMDLFFALNQISRYIDQFGEEFVIEYFSEKVGVECNDYEFITNLPYDRFYEINGEDIGFSFEDGEYYLNKL